MGRVIAIEYLSPLMIVLMIMNNLAVGLETQGKKRRGGTDALAIIVKDGKSVWHNLSC